MFNDAVKKTQKSSEATEVNQKNYRHAPFRRRLFLFVILNYLG